MDIEVFADIWCPFTHVGLRNFNEKRRVNGRSDVGIIVRSWPLELVNGVPMDPAGARQRAGALREQVAPDLFENLDIECFPASTLEALALTVRAYRSDTATGERASFALRDALFERGQDVSDPDVLATIAAAIGISMPDDADRAAVIAEWHNGQRRGVLGSPHFFCGDRNVFCPSLAVTKTADAGLSIQFDRSTLDTFLRDCLLAA